MSRIERGTRSSTVRHFVLCRTDTSEPSPFGLKFKRRSEYGLAIHELPVDQVTLPLYMVWHERFDNDRGHQWLRTALLAVLRE